MLIRPQHGPTPTFGFRWYTLTTSLLLQADMDHKLAKALEVEAMQNTAKAVEAIQAVLEPLQTSLENIQAQSEHIGEIPHLIRAYDDMAESLKLIAARLDAIEKNLDQMVEKIPEGRRASYTKFSPKPTEAPQIHGN